MVGSSGMRCWSFLRRCVRLWEGLVAGVGDMGGYGSAINKQSKTQGAPLHVPLGQGWESTSLMRLWTPSRAMSKRAQKMCWW